jgi:glycosyltransferase involved in cell wall biosynthesis
MDILLDLTPLGTPSIHHGIGKYIQALTEAMASLTEQERLGLEVSALLDLDGDIAPLSPGVTQRKFHPYPDEMKWIWQRRSRLVRQLRKISPRLFHATQNLGTPRGSGIPRVLTCYDLLRLVLHQEYLAGRPVFRRLLHVAEFARFHQAKRVIAISQFTADDMQRLLGISPRKIDVIPLGVDHQRFRPTQSPAEDEHQQKTLEHYGLSSIPYFIYAGAIDPRKGFPTLLQAFAQAKMAGVHLVHMGRISKDLQPLLTQALELAQHPENFKLLGYVPDEDVPILLRGSQALVFPSKYEGFGLPVLEAMACGCPVITTRATALGEVAGEAALFVTPENVEQLREALEQLAKHPELREELRTKGLEQAGRFTWKQTAMATMESYQKALRE